MTTRTLKITFISIIAGACGNDKECVPPPLADQIVGSWNAELTSLHTGPQEITFESDGNFKESKGLLFGTYLKSEDHWKIQNDSLVVEGKFSNGTQAKYEFSIASRTCNEIVLDLEEDKLTLTKR
ncbi:hypothetical protein SAMN04487996_102256 [Dyadobacter soli]|uniref:Lipocalin-like domain-containing protein n=1 Tax=Dyadobacter soli TaxID=659014 RepID=A0A1G6XTT9_9BACT|nr:hypothetical protein [Dyadobacter soli]SDD81560.1 hypothetical protein SAMN04487996_102256 [Dyadobacter soli]